MALGLRGAEKGCLPLFFEKITLFERVAADVENLIRIFVSDTSAIIWQAAFSCIAYPLSLSLLSGK
ncbi:hypothetical protein [Herbaspirillum lusitanum]|uniref:hypothetical protein n=1 Tax=Herbaspirillum lusitanum TaxID=213312 RepID=UPI00223896D9|nr:hypothetical protein [Herbaspirillum lusitanum]